jgi:hypothetical protein
VISEVADDTGQSDRRGNVPCPFGDAHLSHQD